MCSMSVNAIGLMVSSRLGSVAIKMSDDIAVRAGSVAVAKEGSAMLPTPANAEGGTRKTKSASKSDMRMAAKSIGEPSAANRRWIHPVEGLDVIGRKEACVFTNASLWFSMSSGGNLSAR